jgi:hypothetical protein
MPDLQHIIQLRTARLAFLPPSANDLADLYSFFSDASQVYFLFLPSGTPQQLEDFWVNWNYGHWRKFGFGICALRLQINGALIGMCGVSHQFINGKNYYEMSCFILPAYQRQGYATEALQTLGDFLTHTSRHSLFNTQFSAQTSSWSTSWSASNTYVEPDADFVLVVPDHHSAARQIAFRLGLTPLFQTRRGNEPVTVGRYFPPSQQFSEADNSRQELSGILYPLLMFLLIIPIVSFLERALLNYFIREDVAFFVIFFVNILCLILAGKIIMLVSGTGSLLKFVFSKRARQRPDETLFRQLRFWSWLTIPLCLLAGVAGGLICGVWNAGIFSFAAMGLISGLIFMFAFRLGWFDDLLEY